MQFLGFQFCDTENKLRRTRIFLSINKCFIVSLSLVCNDGDDFFLQVQETKHCLMEIGVTIVQSHPFSLRHHLNGIKLPQMLFEGIAFRHLGPYKEDVHLRLRRPWDLGCYHLCQMINMRVICEQQSGENLHTMHCSCGFSPGGGWKSLK